MLGVAEEAEAGCEFLLGRKVQGLVLRVVTCQLVPLKSKRSSQCSTAILPVSSKVTRVCWKQACPDGEGVCSTGLGFRRWHLSVLLGECPHPQVLLSHLNGEVCLCVIAIFMKKCLGKECNLFLKFLLSQSWKSLGIFFTK